MRTKFNISKDIQKRTYNEIVFDSGMEMKYYCDIILPGIESGDIVFCEMQKSYTLQPKFKRDNKTVQPIVYVADFFVRYKDNTERVIDVKGCPDSIAKLKRKLFWYVYPDVDYRWICLSIIDGGWKDYAYVEQQRKLRKKIKGIKGNDKEKE